MTIRTRRILGIDPGSHQLGLGCIEKRGNEIRLLFAETIKAPPSDDIYGRLDFIADRLKLRIDELRPEEVAIEDTFCGKSARSAFRLGVARGVAVGACLGRRIPIYEYAPTRVKQIVTGYGKADKAQVRKMAALTVGTPLELGFDATDAIAVAICHASTVDFNLRVSC